MFEDEYDLAIRLAPRFANAVKESLKKRSRQRGDYLQQFKLNSTFINVETQNDCVFNV